MIVIDTNVLSELTKRRPDPAVVAWLDEQWNDTLATTATTAAELLYGVERLAPGRRRRGLTQAVDFWLDEELEDRVFPFDLAAAGEYAMLMARRDAAGRPMEAPDAQIAAICLSRKARLATRNVAHFEGTGVDLINPWET